MFGETIIKENKDKVRSLANTTLDEFFRETVILNIISLVKTREVMARKGNAINYGKYHSMINNTIDVLILV